jgi:hypothetical protein
MKQTEITAYFEDLATRFKAIQHDPNGIKHFAIIDSDEISAEIKRDLDFNSWCMLLEEAAPVIKSNDAKAFHQYYTFRFTICKDVSRQNATEKREIKEESLELSKAIFAYIIENHKASRLWNATDFALKNIKFEASFEAYENILNENILGYDCLITVSSDFNTKLYNNQTLWN